MVTSIDSNNDKKNCYRCQSNYKVVEFDGKLMCSGFCLKQYKTHTLKKETKEIAMTAPDNNNTDGKPEWKVGDFCKAKWLEDGIIYEAIIEAITATEDGSEYATVKFLGYGNSDSAWLTDLMPSAGAEARKEQIVASGATPDELVEDDNVDEVADGKKEPEFKEGDFCRAIFDADSLEYEAKIVSVTLDEKSKEKYAIVEFLGYGDNQTIWLADLKPSAGEKTRKAQEESAQSQQSFESNEVVQIESAAATEVKPDTAKLDGNTVKETREVANTEGELDANKAQDSLPSKLMATKAQPSKTFSKSENDDKIAVAKAQEMASKPQGNDKDWAVGDFCLAPDVKNGGKVREAIIMHVAATDDGTAFAEIKFAGTSDVDTICLSDIKEKDDTTVEDCEDLNNNNNVNSAGLVMDLKKQLEDASEKLKAKQFQYERLKKEMYLLEQKFKKSESENKAEVDQVVQGNLKAYKEKNLLLEKQNEDFQKKLVESTQLNSRLVKRIEVLEKEKKVSASGDGPVNMSGGQPVHALLSRTENGLIGFAFIPETEMAEIRPIQGVSSNNSNVSSPNPSVYEQASPFQDRNNNFAPPARPPLRRPNTQGQISAPSINEQASPSQDRNGNDCPPGRPPLPRPTISDGAKRRLQRHLSGDNYR